NPPAFASLTAWKIRMIAVRQSTTTSSIRRFRRAFGGATAATRKEVSRGPRETEVLCGASSFIVRRGEPHLASGLGRDRFVGLDQFPELRILLQSFVLLHFQTGTEKEILERVPAEDPMHDHSEIVPLKVDAVVADTESVQNAAGALQFPKLIQLGRHDLL